MLTPARWTVRTRRIGTVHIVRYWEVCRDGEVFDTFDNREMADALAQFRNERITPPNETH